MERAFPGRIEDEGLVSFDLRLMFVPTPKVGCTSIKWALARAEGTVSSSTAGSALGETRSQVIHDPEIHRLANFASLKPEDRRMILEDLSWIRFCVTRDPYSRLLSGWINRVLLNAPDSLGDDLAFARESIHRDYPTDLGEEFRGFVRQLLGPGKPVPTNAHFASQVSLLRLDVFPHTDVVKLKELDEFVARIAASSPARRRFDPRPMNLSLRVDPWDVFDAESAELVDAYFAEDFDQLGYQRVKFPKNAAPAVLSEREVELISIVRAKSERVHDLQQLNASHSTLRGRVHRRTEVIRGRVQATARRLRSGEGS